MTPITQSRVISRQSEVEDLDNEVSNIAAKKLMTDFNSFDAPIRHEEIKIQFPEESNQKVNLNKNLSNTEDSKIFEGTNPNIWAVKLLQTVIQSIKIIGFNTSKIPAITNLAHLMNISFYLRKEKRNLEDALEADFMQGTILISSKRNTQAVELLRNKV